ncbi:hypothetical protein BN997_01088 [Oceanobacillus oncorhynchi]|uniref:Uncharacterized protein n=1 Tax=Oceanobacillus oncorhynchi TaxID=545501 RepID=A0A0A1M7K0_9BACI|nr:hypothetical protein [Oceanobacillus oncorhynchi]CEI81270.1 hypothetical protein BN997_01088 [Oceanobacillus oncorhynchi]
MSAEMIPTDNQPLHLKAGLDYVYAFEDLELTFTKKQLDRIAFRWESGESLEDIAKKERRKDLEILLGLIHLARRRVFERPFAFRPSN